MNSLRREWRRVLRESKRTVKEPVKIPETLIEKLKPFGPRFIKVRPPVPGDEKSGKGAVEHEWQLHPYTTGEMEDWLSEGGNYGVLCGRGLYGVDLDAPELQVEFEKSVDTFTLQSGGGEGKHYYILSDVTENGTVLGNLGNIQVKNKFLVGPGSVHYTGGRYKIVKNVDFAWVRKADLEIIFGQRLVWTGHQLEERVEAQAKDEAGLIGFTIPISEIIDLKELRRIGKDELQGSHPIHGSKTGQNFCVNVAKNCWHCFRCNSGGGPLSWFAVKYGLLRCDQAQKGTLKGKLFHKTVELARSEGFDVELEVSLPSPYFKDGKFVPSLLAKELMDKNHYVTRKADKEIFVYQPESGIYIPNGEAQIMTEVRKTLGEHFRRNRLSEVLTDITCSTLTDIKTAPPHLIALKNGIFNLKTKKLEGFTPDYFILNTLPIRYNPETDCPNIKKFISEVVDETDVPVLQEGAGYCLYRDYIIHVAIMLIGEGANGKSTFMTVLVAMLGMDNVASLPLQALEQRFTIGVLEGKLANICPDLSAQALRETGNFKNLTGNDPVEAEHKFKGHFNFRNYAKMWFSANLIPETKDDTTAFFRRWVIINFPNQFLPGDPKTDKNLADKLTTEDELSGFFNWVIEGLERLLRNGKFSTGKSVEETREQYIRMSDPVKAFTMDRIRSQADSNPLKDEVYRIFLLYCHQNHLPTIAKNTFSMKLAEHVPGLTETRQREDGKTVKRWSNIKVSETDVEETDKPTPTDPQPITPKPFKGFGKLEGQ